MFIYRRLCKYFVWKKFQNDDINTLYVLPNHKCLVENSNFLQYIVCYVVVTSDIDDGYSNVTEYVCGRQQTRNVLSHVQTGLINYYYRWIFIDNNN